MATVDAMVSLFGAVVRDIPLKHIATRTYVSGLVQSEYEVAQRLVKPIIITENRFPAMSDPTPAQQLRSFLAKFEPRVASSARVALARLRKKFPGAVEIVYDNYNALAIGFGPSDRASEAIFSIAVFPRWVSLFFLRGAKLPDPDKVLKGSGTQARHIVLTDPKILERPAVKKLMALALKSAKTPIDPKQRRRLIIKSVSAKQRPRRPST